MVRAHARKPRDLGAVVRAVREERGLRQEDLAERLVIPRDYLIALEGGRSTLQLTRLFRTFNELGIKVTLEWEEGS